MAGDRQGTGGNACASRDWKGEGLDGKSNPSSPDGIFAQWLLKTSSIRFLLTVIAENAYFMDSFMLMLFMLVREPVAAEYGGRTDGTACTPLNKRYLHKRTAGCSHPFSINCRFG